MCFSLARVGAVVGMNVEDYFQNGKRWWIMTIMWQAETPETPIPAEYLKE